MSLSQKRNLLIIGSSQGVYGGIEAFMIAICEAAVTWPEFKVRLCFKLVKNATAQNDLKMLADKVGVEVYFVQRGSADLLKLVSWADILHVQNTPPDITFLAFLLRKKIFLTIHNKRIREFSFHSIIWGFSMKLATRRWYNSKFVWHTWEPNEPSGKSDCVPTVCRFSGVSAPPADRKGFLFVGRWIANKGIEEILQAYAKTGFDPIEQPLTILGDGPLKEKVMQLIASLNLKDVYIPGFVDDITKAKLMASARWILAPANTLEDLGLTPIEGRNAGVPSIVSRDGGLPEAGGEAALIVEPGDAIDLAEKMMIAAQMGPDEYYERSILARESLSTFLKPMTFYRTAFLND